MESIDIRRLENISGLRLLRSICRLGTLSAAAEEQKLSISAASHQLAVMKDFFKELVQYHISGQLKVAPEHCVSSVLDYMGKPHFDVFLKFWRQYKKLNEQDGTEQ